MNRAKAVVENGPGRDSIAAEEESGQGREEVPLSSVICIWTHAGEHGRPAPTTIAPVASHHRGVAQLGSAPALGAGGPGFESRRPDFYLELGTKAFEAFGDSSSQNLVK